MKKYLFFIFALSIGCAFADDIAQDNKQPARVKLTNEEQQLVQRIIGIARGENALKNDYNGALLCTGCGIFMTWQWQEQSYNLDEYPDCPQVIQFLKKYVQRVDELNIEAKDLQKNIFDRKIERLQKAQAH